MNDTRNVDPLAASRDAAARGIVYTVPVIDAIVDGVGSVQGAVAPGGYTDDGRPTISGRGRPGDLVHVYDNDLLLGRVRVPASGQWSLVPLRPLAEGAHGISVRDIAVSSRPGEGTCVTLRLPLEVLDPADGQPAVPPRPHVQLALRKWRILVVDDRPANRVLLVEQLSFLGQAVVSAQNGEEALALWRTHGFDMVITDCCMPVMDGYTLSRRIREDERARGASPCAVIGYTANALPEERIRCLDAGMDDCLFKPLTLSALSSRLASLQGSGMSGDGTTVAVDGSMMAMVRALTGDDDRLACVFLDEAIDSFRHDLDAVLAWREDPQVPALAALAHGIKGGARMVDAGEVVHACERVEQACQYPLHPQLLETAVAELAARLETTTAQAIALREVLCDGRCPAAA